MEATETRAPQASPGPAASAPGAAGQETGLPAVCAVSDASGEPRWLSAEQQGAWRQLVGLLHDLPSALDRQTQVDAGIPHAYYLILAMLSEAPDHELRMTELAQRTSASLSRLSHAVARLEEHGWVERRRCPTDRRGQIAALTRSGYAQLVGLAPGHVAAVQRYVFDVLSPEQVGQLHAICEAVRTAIADDEGRAADR